MHIFISQLYCARFYTVFECIFDWRVTEGVGVGGDGG